MKKLLLILSGILIPFFLFFVLFVPMGLVLMNSSKLQNRQTKIKNIGLSQDVLRWKSIVEEFAFKNEMGDYVDLILAVMMQESGGKGLDVMQCSEGGFNTKYPKAPNSIIDPVYSIECGIKELRAALKNADVKGPGDIENIKLALQSYNFGPGYIQYARERGGYSEENAKDFSATMAQKMNWSGYGDPLYIDHVLRYCAVYDISNDFSGASERFQGLMKEAIKHEGKRYFLGDIIFENGVPITFDCSNLTQWCYKSIGIDIPRTAQQQYDFMNHIPIEEAVPGDLIFFRNTYPTRDYITHVAIYQGGMEVFHAGDPVGYANINTPYWLDKTVCAGRIKEN